METPLLGSSGAASRRAARALNSSRVRVPDSLTARAIDPFVGDAVPFMMLKKILMSAAAGDSDFRWTANKHELLRIAEQKGIDVAVLLEADAAREVAEQASLLQLADAAIKASSSSEPDDSSDSELNQMADDNSSKYDVRKSTTILKNSGDNVPGVPVHGRQPSQFRTSQSNPAALLRLSTLDAGKLTGLDALLDSVASEAVAPLRGSWLTKLHACGGTLQRRQELPAEAFWSKTELRRAAHALGPDYGLLFVSVSSRWLSYEQADPHGFHLATLAQVCALQLGLLHLLSPSAPPVAATTRMHHAWLPFPMPLSFRDRRFLYTISGDRAVPRWPTPWRAHVTSCRCTCGAPAS